MNIPFLKEHPRLVSALDWLLKIIIFVLLAWAIYRQVFVNKDINTIRSSIVQSLSTHSWLFIVVAILMLVNWGLEALKWRMLVNKVEVISPLDAFMAVLCGVTFTMFTPNRMGEYGGRFLLLKEPLRPTAFQATILGSIAQIITTLIFGMIGLAYHMNGQGKQLLSHNIFGILWLVLAIPLLLFTYFNADIILENIPLKEKWKQKLNAWVHYTGKELTIALLLAIARYSVYTLQYLLLLQIFLNQPSINFHNAANVSLVFLIQTIIPSVALLDLGVRGGAALTFISDGTNGIGVVAAAFSLWLINLVLPAVLGYIIILSRRIFSRP